MHPRPLSRGTVILDLFKNTLHQQMLRMPFKSELVCLADILNHLIHINFVMDGPCPGLCITLYLCAQHSCQTLAWRPKTILTYGMEAPWPAPMACGRIITGHHAYVNHKCSHASHGTCLFSTAPCNTYMQHPTQILKKQACSADFPSTKPPHEGACPVM